MAARGPYGQNSLPTKRPKWNPTKEPAPKIVSRGTLSKPSKPSKWSPKTLPQDSPGKIIQS